MRRIVVIFALLMSFLFSFLKEGPLEMEEVDQNKILYTQITTEVHTQEINWLVKKKADMSAFCRAAHTTQFKQIGDRSYIVLKSSDGFFLVTFDKAGNYLSRLHIVFSADENEEFIANVKTRETTFAEVRTADPTGNYPCLYAGYSGFPKYSLHFFRSGKCYYLRFDDNGENVLEDIVHFTI